MDGSQSSVFPQDRQDRALCVTGCHLTWVSKLLRARGGLGGSNLKIKMAAINGKTCYISMISRKNRGL